MQVPLLAGVSASLGDEVWRCRRRTRAAVYVDRRGSIGYLHLMLYPWILGGIPIAVAMAIVRATMGQTANEALLWSCLGGMYVTLVVSIYMYLFAKPDEAQLTLYAHGLSYGSKSFLFSELMVIFVGRNERGVGQATRDASCLLRAFDSATPSVQTSEVEEFTGLTVVRNDRTRVELPRVLLEHRFDDLQQFFRIIERNHPEVKLEAP